MDIAIDPSDGLPIYRQIANQIRYMVASGLLQPGEEIPSIRSLALRLKVTPNTVVKAYQDLESSGVLEKRAGAGTYVKAGPTPLADRRTTMLAPRKQDRQDQWGWGQPGLCRAITKSGPLSASRENG